MERLLSNAKVQKAEMEERVRTAGDRGKIAFLLEKIRKELDITSDLTSEEGAMTSILQKLQEILGNQTFDETAAAKILGHIKSVSEEDMGTLEQFNKSFHEVSGVFFAIYRYLYLNMFLSSFSF